MELEANFSMNASANCLVSDGGGVNIFYLSMYSILFIIGVPVNLVVIGAIIFVDKMRTVSHMYVLNLALADLLHFMSYPVLFTVTIHKSWPPGFPVHMCNVQNFLYAITTFASSAFLGVLSWDRYQAICHPHCTCFTRTLRKAIIICALCWLVVIIEMLPVLQYSRVYTDFDQTRHCVLDWRSGTRNIFTIYACITGYVIPLAAIWIFYANILKKLWKKRAHILGRNRLRKNIRVTLFCCVICMTYSLLFLPFWFIQLSIEMGVAWTKTALRAPISISAYFLLDLNGAINPFLYGFITDAFRKLFCARRYELRALSKSDDSIRNTACDFSRPLNKRLTKKARKFMRSRKRSPKRRSRIPVTKFRPLAMRKSRTLENEHQSFEFKNMPLSYPLIFKQNDVIIQNEI